jgi:transcriptional regulator with XRE-family HTH domain
MTETSNQWPQRDEFRRLVKALCKERGWTNKAVADKLDISPDHLKNLLYRPSSKPSLELAVGIAQFFNVPLSELFNAPGSKAVDAIDDAPDDDEILVPWYSTRLSAGPGGAIDDRDLYTSQSMPFSKRWLRQFLNITPSNAALFNVEGDSMEPTLHGGEMVIVDLGSRAAGFQDGVWMVCEDGAVMVKRIMKLGGGQFQLSSDNPNPIYPPPRPLDGELIGRVVYRGGRM